MRVLRRFALGFWVFPFGFSWFYFVGCFLGVLLGLFVLFLVRCFLCILPVYLGAPHAFNKTVYYLSKKKNGRLVSLGEIQNNALAFIYWCTVSVYLFIFIFHNPSRFLSHCSLELHAGKSVS